MSAIETLAAFVAGTRLADLPEDVIDRGRLILADCIGCIVAGSTAPELRRLIALQPQRAGPTATALGTRSGLAPDAAAFFNGTSGTWHDLDEGNLSTRTHAGIQIVPAVLAETEARRHSGVALLEAMILAYEASARLWRATTARLAVHPHGTYGPLAAALALGKLRGDAAPALAQAANIALTLGLAASRNALNDGATVRNVYTGHSGRAGFEALALRDAGFTGEADAAASILGNIYGSAFDADAAVAELGRTWWIRRNYFKRFAAGRYAHAALDLVEDLAARHGGRIDATQMARCDVATFFMAATMGQQSVRTPFGLRFSIPMAVARRIAHGPVALTDDGARAFGDPAVHALAQRIFVAEDKAATAAYPDKQPTRLTVTWTDGRSETLACERILGESDHPLPEGVLRDKFTALAGAAWPQRTAAAAWDALAHIEQVQDLCPLFETWRGAGADPREQAR